MRSPFKIIKHGNKRDEKTRLWKKQNGLCFICHEKIFLDIEHPHPRAITIEHLTPRSRGGGNEFSNKLVSHYECNKKRGNPDVKLNQEQALLKMKFDFIHIGGTL